MEFDVNFPEEDHEHELVEVEVFSVVDDEGNEDFYKKLDEVAYEGEIYWVCQEVFLDPELTRVEDEGDIHIFKEVNLDGEEYVEYVDDYELAKKVFDIWEERLGEGEGEEGS